MNNPLYYLGEKNLIIYSNSKTKHNTEELPHFPAPDWLPSFRFLSSAQLSKAEGRRQEAEASRQGQ